MSEARLKIVDLCCGAGGASLGYASAGFDVVGMDREHQKNYPFRFIRGDVLTDRLPEAHAYHVSPPCQQHSVSTKRYRNLGREYCDIIDPIRQRLLATGKPFIMENVIGAPLRRDIVLCGEMFGLRVQRHRIFEIHGFGILSPPHQKHKGLATSIKDRFGYRAPVSEVPASRKELYYYTVCGHGRRERDGLENWRAAMGIFHMSRRELSQAIPPAYTQYIGEYLMRHLLLESLT